MAVVWICRRRVRTAFVDDFHHTRNGRIFAAVVEEAQIAFFHVVTHEITGLIVAHAVPAGSLIRRGGQIRDGVTVRFAFEQPVAHESSFRSRADAAGAGCKKGLGFTPSPYFLLEPPVRFELTIY